jgi:hypothetical protein
VGAPPTILQITKPAFPKGAAGFFVNWIHLVPFGEKNGDFDDIIFTIRED